MTRLTGVVFGFIAAIFGWMAIPSSASAALQEAPHPNYVYDSPNFDAHGSGESSERGSPRSYDLHTAYSAIELQSGGTSARASDATTLPIYTYDGGARLAQVDSAKRSIADTAPRTASGLRLFQRWRVAAKSAPKSTAVIGRQWDTAVAKDWPGHQVLDIPDWSLAKNDAWVNGVIQRGQKVYIGSPETKANLWDVVNNRSTVFGRELSQFSGAGYSRSGNYLLPPGW